MRHTLIPYAEKKALHREYYTRLCVVSLFALSIVALISSAALIPAFMKASTEEVLQLHAIKIADQQKDDQTPLFKEELAAAKVLSLGLASGMKDSFLSDSIISVIAARGDSSIMGISALRVATSSIVVSVQGKAPTRNALISFKDKIQSTISAAKVDLPDEVLTQAKNVVFSFKVNIDMP